jgi:two-component system KDP operon response regulator KdpE
VRILVVDDERAVREAIQRALRLEGYDVEMATDGQEALFALARRGVDAIVLDVLMPVLDGLETARKLRRQGNSTPILMLTARHEVSDRVAGLDAGADDYLVKPFALEELLARLRAVLRRAGQPGDPVIEIGELRLDLERSLVTVDGEQVHLTPREFRILRLLAQNEGKLLTHRTILREVWGPAYGDESNYLHVYLSQLRRKIEPDPTSPRYLLTEPGAGYRLVAP